MGFFTESQPTECLMSCFSLSTFIVIISHNHDLFYYFFNHLISEKHLVKQARNLNSAAGKLLQLQQ